MFQASTVASALEQIGDNVLLVSTKTFAKTLERCFKPKTALVKLSHSQTATVLKTPLKDGTGLVFVLLEAVPILLKDREKVWELLLQERSNLKIVLIFLNDEYVDEFIANDPN